MVCPLFFWTASLNTNTYINIFPLPSLLLLFSIAQIDRGRYKDAIPYAVLYSISIVPRPLSRHFVKEDVLYNDACFLFHKYI